MNNNDLIKFLIYVDKTFPIPLSNKTSICEYADKLINNADFCYKEDGDGNILGLVAGYLNDINKKIAYISIVAVKKEYYRQGIAKNLIIQFIEKCKEKSMNSIHLYTHKTNKGAISLYNKLGFVEYNDENEIRNDDYHFILYLK